jgi:hypothetical protein
MEEGVLVPVFSGHRFDLVTWRECIENAGIFSTFTAPIYISGPEFSGKYKIGRAIAEKRSDRFLVVDVQKDGLPTFIKSLPKITENTTLFVRINDQTPSSICEELADTVAKYGNQNYIRFIISCDINKYNPFQRNIPPNEFRGLVKFQVLQIPPLSQRPWDIVVNLVYLLKKTQIQYITYNSFDFILWHNWPGV